MKTKAVKFDLHFDDGALRSETVHGVWFSTSHYRKLMAVIRATWCG